MVETSILVSFLLLNRSFALIHSPGLRGANAHAGIHATRYRRYGASRKAMPDNSIQRSLK